MSGVTGAHRDALYVSGLDEQVDESSLHAAFVPFGPIRDVSIPVDYRSGHRKGFGFVRFIEAEDASEALDNMHRNELLGRTIAVAYAHSHQLHTGSSGLRTRAVWQEDADAFAQRLTEQQMQQRRAHDMGKSAGDVYQPQPAEIAEDEPMEAAEREAHAALQAGEH